MSIVPSSSTAINNNSNSNIAPLANSNTNQAASNNANTQNSSENANANTAGNRNSREIGLPTSQTQSSPQSGPSPQQQFANLSVSALSSSFLNKNSPIAASNSTKQESANSAPKTLVSSTTDSPQYELQENIKSKNQAVVYDDINIFMWSVCKICNKSTKKFAMSPHTWSFSLAKFLDLTFHAKNYHQFNEDEAKIACKHSLFQDHYQYFRFKNIVTVFSTCKISIRLLQLPPVLLKSNVKLIYMFILVAKFETKFKFLPKNPQFFFNFWGCVVIFESQPIFNTFLRLKVNSFQFL